MSPAPPIVTLTTDFGEGSRYVAAMKGVMLTINPAVRIVDLTHSIAPQNVLQGAIALAETTPWFPPGTLHVAVVDPGVGSERRIVYVEIAGQKLLVPDNGLVSCLAQQHKPTTIVVVERKEFWAKDVSNTFHGRDIFAPVAARLSQGLDPCELGRRTDEMEILPLPEAERVQQKIEGEVTEVDSFGNLITNITSDMLDGVPSGESVRVKCDDHETFGIFRSYSDQPSMTLIALVGSGGKLELAIVDENASIMLGIPVGTPVTVQW